MTSTTFFRAASTPSQGVITYSDNISNEEETQSTSFRPSSTPSQGVELPQPKPALIQEEQVQPEQPSDKFSLKELQQDDEFYDDILQYRLDRFGIEKDKGAYNFLLGAFVGPTQDLTPENLVDDYLDHYRGVINNTVINTSERNWLNSVKEKEDIIIKSAEAKGISVNELDIPTIDKLNDLREQRARALRLYKKADNFAGLLDSKRYENMDFYEKVGDVASTVGTNVAHTIGDPITAFTVGVGKLLGMAASTAGVTPLKSALISAATTAPLEAGASAVLDLQVQKAEIEMGFREEIDTQRTATVAGIAAVTAGVLSGVGTKSAVTRVDKANRGQITQALKNNVKNQEKIAKQTNKILSKQSNDLRERLAKGITDAYGDDAIIRNNKGIVTGINSSVIKTSDEALATKLGRDGEDIVVEESIDFGTFERVIAGMSEVLQAAKEGKITYKNVSKQTAKDYNSPLQKNEMISDRLLNILSNADLESHKFLTDVLGKYGITQKELAASMFADASYAGQRLNRLAQLSNNFRDATRRRSASEVADDAAEATIKSTADNFSRLKRFEDIRRLTLVSGIATAVRNNISQVLRSGTDTLIYAFESAFHNAFTGRQKFSLKSVLSQLNHTFYNSKDADTVARLLLDMYDGQKARYFNNYSEVTMRNAKNNPGQAATSKIQKGLNTETPILDRWEGTIHAFNSLNRYQEFLYRHGMFTASVQRQLGDRGVDLFDVLKSGKITENLNEDIIAKAVDDALDFTYAAQPKLKWFKTWNNFIVQSGLTLAIPFPRFMFKALEMTYNYNVTGIATGLMRMAKSGIKEGRIKDGEVRQLAEGVAGGIPLIFLGYQLRDPEGPHAGSEWYKLKDNLGNEFDARPFFPLTPYLLMGEMWHRLKDDRAGKFTEFFKEVVPALTGTNFRGSGAAGKMVEDILNIAATGGDEIGFKTGAKEVGKYIGEAVSGYGQPIFQFADIFTTSDQRMKDYKDDPEYREGVKAFFTNKDIIGGGVARDLLYYGEEALKGFWQPFESRLRRVGESVGFEYDAPYTEDPRFEDVPERVMPFMKILFGATLTRVPPRYVQELNRYGFNYVDFMSKTNSPSLDRAMNREMGIDMQTLMPEMLKKLDIEYGVDRFKEDLEKGTMSQKDINEMKALEIKKFISEQKRINYEVLRQQDDLRLQALLQKYKKLGFRSRGGGVAAFREIYQRDPSLNSSSDISEVIRMASDEMDVFSSQLQSKN